jgi:hypothetical protein
LLGTGHEPRGDGDGEHGGPREQSRTRHWEVLVDGSEAGPRTLSGVQPLLSKK